LKLLYRSGGFTGYFLSTTSESDTVNVTDCYLVSNSTASNWYLIIGSAGYITITNSTLDTFNFDKHGILYYSPRSIWSSHDTFRNCVFHSISSSGIYPLLILAESNEVFLSVISSTFKNVLISGEGNNGYIIWT
jgi:hypothetical protein